MICITHDNVHLFISLYYYYIYIILHLLFIQSHVILRSLNHYTITPYIVPCFYIQRTLSKFPYSNSNFNCNNTSKDSRSPCSALALPMILNCLLLSTLAIRGKSSLQKLHRDQTSWPSYIHKPRGEKRWSGVLAASKGAREKNEAGGSTLWPKC